MENLWCKTKSSLNFFRIHILTFTFTPLIFSAIFYASNGEFHIAYIDALFLCISAMTVTGLATVDLSSLTGFQQALLFVLSCLGSPVTVAWVMVYTRRYYFAKKFEHVVQAELARRVREDGTEGRGSTNAFSRTLSRVFTRQQTKPRYDAEDNEKRPSRMSFMTKSKLGTLGKLRPDMIRRMDAPPQPINPSGLISEQDSPQLPHRRVTDSPQQLEKVLDSSSQEDLESSSEGSNKRNQELSTERTDARPRLSPIQSSRPHGVPLPDTSPTFARTHTVEFRTPPTTAFRARSHSRQDIPRRISSERSDARSSSFYRDQDQPNPISAYRSSTMHTQRSERPAMERGFGGFPTPQTLIIRLLTRFFPDLKRRVVKTVTIPRTTTLASVAAGASQHTVKTVSYLTFNAIVGRNSKFHMLTEENLEELGGAEYRGLTALLWIVAGYHIGIQVLSFVVIAPYISLSRWRSDFEPPQLHRYVPPSWFAAFQVVSAYTNTGTSLVDQSMVPFQRAYPMIFVMAFLILAGNTAFPIFLRLTIWIITKLVPRRSRVNETLHFLLDHPRRCFIYLFPSHQTWFLVTVVVLLNMTDWFFFLVLDIGNPEIESIPLGVRFTIGLLQATAVRSSGFVTVSLSALAPAVQVLYVLMMYVSVYPIALSVRSTNVYEERSLGIFEDDVSQKEEEPNGNEGSRVAIWGRYLSWHARKQLAFDMWWIGLGLFLICIIERSKLENEANFGWFTIFTIVFEMVSAYGTVGLSLGVPYASFSFSGALTPLSKLIICAVMLRGRHRGLPVAIDRAIMLPFEFGAGGKKDDQILEEDEEDNLDDTLANASTNAKTNANVTMLHDVHGSISANDSNDPSDDGVNVGGNESIVGNETFNETGTAGVGYGEGVRLGRRTNTLNEGRRRSVMQNRHADEQLSPTFPLSTS